MLVSATSAAVYMYAIAVRCSPRPFGYGLPHGAAHAAHGASSFRPSVHASAAAAHLLHDRPELVFVLQVLDHRHCVVALVLRVPHLRRLRSCFTRQLRHLKASQASFRSQCAYNTLLCFADRLTNFQCSIADVTADSDMEH